MMKKLSILVLPLVLAISAMVMLGGVSTHVSAQLNQTSTQGNQTSGQNQTSSSQSPQSQDEKLLNLTTQTIKAFKDKKNSEVTDNLKQLQDMLINATGKQLVVVPSDSGSSSDKSTSSSSSSSSSSDSDKSKESTK